jgi:hypothetical protein
MMRKKEERRVMLRKKEDRRGMLRKKEDSSVMLRRKEERRGNAEEKGHATRTYGNKAEGINGETAREIKEGKKELMNVERREH